MYLIKSGINLFYVWTGVSTCKIEFHNIIFIFITFSFIIFGDHIVLVFKLYQTILNHNITHALSVTEREKLVHALCTALQTQFEDTTYGVVQATANADFKIWPLEEGELEGIRLQHFIIIPAFYFLFVLVPKYALPMDMFALQVLGII